MTTGRLRAAAAFALAFAAGCGGGEEPAPPVGGDVPGVADEGCVESHPIRQRFGDPSWDVLVHVCTSADGTELRADNVSSLVLVVRTSEGSPTLQIEPPPSAPSFAEETVRAAVPSGCAAAVCVLLAGQVLRASDELPFRIDFAVDGRLTLTANAAASLASWMLRHVAPTRAAQGRAIACAQQAETVTRIAKGLRGGTWIDGLLVTATRVLHR